MMVWCIKYKVIVPPLAINSNESTFLYWLSIHHKYRLIFFRSHLPNGHETRKYVKKINNNTYHTQNWPLIISPLLFFQRNDTLSWNFQIKEVILFNQLLLHSIFTIALYFFSLPFFGLNSYNFNFHFVWNSNVLIIVYFIQDSLTFGLVLAIGTVK